MKTTDLCRLEALEEARGLMEKRFADLAAQLAALAALHSEGESWNASTFAKFLGVSREAVLRMARDGQAPFHTFGKRIRFTPEDRKAYLASTVGVPAR